MRALHHLCAQSLHQSMSEITSWPKIEAWAKSEITRLLEKNASPELDLVETNAIRGEIRALKRLLRLPTAEAERAQMTRAATAPGY